MTAGAAPKFALNHMTAPGLDCRSFLDLAASLGCVGVELRNDLADKKFPDATFFDGEATGSDRRICAGKRVAAAWAVGSLWLQLWNDAMRAKVQLLIDQAKASGAESISLIPRNDAPAGALPSVSWRCAARLRLFCRCWTRRTWLLLLSRSGLPPPHCAARPKLWRRLRPKAGMDGSSLFMTHFIIIWQAAGSFSRNIRALCIFPVLLIRR